jgi:predicted ABC-type ATPase
MYIVAGPPGSGKSTVFPVSGFGVESFNADDLAAQLNRGSYRGIPQSVRARVNRLFEAFVHDCVARRSSFAVETTLRSSITFDQAASARREGFFIEMHYLALTNFAQHVERVKIRADRGGHSAPEAVLRSIYDSSLRNLARAILEMDAMAVYDNSEPDAVPRVLLQAEGGNVVYVAEQCPEWLERALVQL